MPQRDALFDKILIANRGEIACRVIQTARRLGIASVAVYSEADAKARHVALADEAWPIGPPPARESYLKSDAVIAAALKSGAQAMHPGYGFLSENADFAEACTAAGLVFIGPPPAAIRALGSKDEAKRLMEAAGVPLVPGYHGTDQDDTLLAAEAKAIGYPLLIKAAAGGGGKGMRVVEAEAGFTEALKGARREAESAFGDGRVILERYLVPARHVEVQVFADSQGNAVHLFERDCSLQRRHQKVLEEAPACDFSVDLRRRMGEAAVAAARASGYVGAGTVEFLLSNDDFYFMEMNTRLQVEHPVTEMITGLDLVEWQLLVAAGRALPLAQEEIRLEGHALEARLYAEDPSRDFLPAAGRLVHLRLPPVTAHARIDSGVVEGDEISAFYDPMIAKVIVWDRDRPRALKRLRDALAASRVVGPANNLAFLMTLVAHPAIAAGAVDTGFIERERAALLPESAPAGDEVLALGALAGLLARRRVAAAAAARSADPDSPWRETDAWRLNLAAEEVLVFVEEGETREVGVAHLGDGGYRFRLPGGAELSAHGTLREDGELLAEFEGRRLAATVVRHEKDLIVVERGHQHRLRPFDPLEAVAEAGDRGARVLAPMAGKVVEVLVAAGAAVGPGTPLVVLEAMKMEHSITAPRDGRIGEIFFAAGDLVEDGVELLALEVDDPGHDEREAAR